MNINITDLYGQDHEIDLDNLGNQAFCMDCMELMKALPDKAFQLAVVDPPYGIGIDGNAESIDYKNPKHTRKGHKIKGWDSDIPAAEYFRELERVSVNQIIWGGNYFVEHLFSGHKGWVIWDKGQHGLTMSDCEIAYSSFDTPTRIIVLNRVELLLEGTIHPTQKPIKLYEQLLINYAHKGDRILDTHLGSQSSRIAAWQAEYDFLGCEIDKDYYEQGCQRYESYAAQYRLC